MMGQLDDLLIEIRKYNKKYEITENSSEADKLRHKIMHVNHTDEEYLALQEELKAFIASNPPEEELERLEGCGESLAMICSAIREKNI